MRGFGLDYASADSAAAFAREYARASRASGFVLIEVHVAPEMAAEQARLASRAAAGVVAAHAQQLLYSCRV